MVLHLHPPSTFTFTPRPLIFDDIRTFHPSIQWQVSYRLSSCPIPLSFVYLPLKLRSPAVPAQAADNHHQADAGLPAGWEVRHSNSKNLPYYFNDAEKQSRWEPPQGTDTEKLKSYMAEHHSAPQPTSENAQNGTAVSSGKIRAGHLLVKHKDSRRPSSWREVRIMLHGYRGLSPDAFNMSYLQIARLRSNAPRTRL